MYKMTEAMLILLGAGISILGIHFFTYREEINGFTSNVGEFTFMMWLPMIIGGLGFLFFKSE